MWFSLIDRLFSKILFFKIAFGFTYIIFVTIFAWNRIYACLRSGGVVGWFRKSKLTNNQNVEKRYTLLMFPNKVETAVQ